MSQKPQAQSTTPSIPKLFFCKLDPYNVHVFEEPTVLPCGNTACLECIQASLVNGFLQCNFEKCKSKHELKDCTKLIQNIMIDETINENINSIAKYFYNELKEKFNQYKGIDSNSLGLTTETFYYLLFF
jgi:hypothetical protein